jgi:hypothetical protein
MEYGTSLAKLVCAIALVVTAACSAPPAHEDFNRLAGASAAKEKYPQSGASGSACFSASVHETRRDGKIDCFYSWNREHPACVQSTGLARLNDRGT